MEQNIDINQIINKVSTSKYVKFLQSVDRQITCNLQACEIETRPVKSNGLWCSLLIPAVLTGYTLLYPVSPVYSMVTYTSLGLLFYSCLFLVFMSVSCLVLKEPVYGGCIASSLVSTLMMYLLHNQDLTFSFIISTLSIFGFMALVWKSIAGCPKTFTVGEAMVVCQAIVLYAVMMLLKLFDGNQNPDVDLVNAVINTVLATVALIITALLRMTTKQREDVNHLMYVVGGAVVFAVVLLHLVLGVSSIVMVLRFLFFDVKRLQLLSFWLFLVAVSVVVLVLRTQLAVKATTVTRKVFHVLGSAVFLSGMLCDVPLMSLAAGVGLALIILLEALRKIEMEPISSALQSTFLVFSDEKDCGVFAMTPIYLFCGLACPLLVVPSHGGQRLELLSGVLSIGVGDTAASWFGSRYGFNKWPDSSKSVEGTAFNVMSQVLTVYTLQLFELLDANNALLRTAVAGTISALVEAKTEQVDNLLLPLVTMLGFQLTWFLC